MERLNTQFDSNVPERRGRRWLHLLLGGSLVALLGWPGCAVREGEREINAGDPVHVTFIHTTDQHSRLVPYNYEPTTIDRNLGIDTNYAPFGGIARMTHLVRTLRESSYRTVYLDSGDLFQGGPIFNFFRGEVEMKSMALLNPDSYALGNHDFDNGSRNLYDQLSRWTRFPALAANYVFPLSEDPRGIYLGEIAKPFYLVNVHGLQIAIIGMANVSSMTSVGEGGNSLGIQPLDEIQTLQQWIDFLEPVSDLVLLLSHLGLNEDERVIRKTRGLDIVFGGHHHVVLNPPKMVTDLSGRTIPLVHSGAFLKFVGVLDAVIQNHEVVSHRYRVIPVDARVPEDRQSLRLMEPYLQRMNQQADLRRVLAYAPRTIPRYGKVTGDSALGNLVTLAMLKRRSVEADFALTNSLGIRSDLYPGPISEEMLYNVFPFENYITKMLLSGQDIVEMLDFVAQRSASRGCQSQVQVAGVRFKMHCLVDEPSASWADEVVVGSTWNGEQWVGGEQIVGPRTCYNDKGDITPLSYDVSLNDYIARGGSGFDMLKINPSKIYTSIALRTAVGDYLRKLPACGSLCAEGSATPEQCGILRKCVYDLTEFYAEECQLPWRTCTSSADCPEGRSCIAGICQSCTKGECRDYMAIPTCNRETDTPKCGEGELCDPLRVSEALDDNDVLYCYRQDCYDAWREVDPTRVPRFCRTDVDQACVERWRIRAEEECPQLPCVNLDEDGRISFEALSLKTLPEECRRPAEDQPQRTALLQALAAEDELCAAFEEACLP